MTLPLSCGTRPRVYAVSHQYHLSGLKKGVTLVQCFHSLYTSHADTGVNQANKEKRAVIFKRAESYVKEYRDAEREKIRLNRLSRKGGSFYVEAEPKLVFVMRIKGWVSAFTATDIHNDR